MKVKAIPTHHMSHIYETYAKKLLAENPHYWSKYHNKIHHFYIYKRIIDERGITTTIEVFSYKLFRNIVEQYFDRAKTAIINGECLTVNSCGKICGKRVERDFRNAKQKQVNWGKSNKYREFNEEKGKIIYTKLIYFTGDDWLRIGWFKPGIKNEVYYEFEPAARNSSGTSGFKYEFSTANTNNPLLKYRYPFYQIKDYLKEE